LHQDPSLGRISIGRWVDMTFFVFACFVFLRLLAMLLDEEREEDYMTCVPTVTVRWWSS